MKKALRVSWLTLALAAFGGLYGSRTDSGQKVPDQPSFSIDRIRADFVTKFGNSSDKATEVQTSILQALTLMNGKVVADATSLARSETRSARGAPNCATRGVLNGHGMCQ